MQTVLDPLRDHAYAALRIVAGFLFACHGMQKVFGILGREAQDPLSFMWFAGIIELVGGAMLVFGFLTGIAAFLCSGMMAVAYFMAHQFSGNGFWPIENRGELAVLYCFLFLYISMKGSGVASVDQALTRR